MLPVRGYLAMATDTFEWAHILAYWGNVAGLGVGSRVGWGGTKVLVSILQRTRCLHNEKLHGLQCPWPTTGPYLDMNKYRQV